MRILGSGKTALSIKEVYKDTVDCHFRDYFHYFHAFAKTGNKNDHVVLFVLLRILSRDWRVFTTLCIYFM